MNEEQNKPTQPGESAGGLKEPHLIDWGSVADVANWIGMAAASGIIGNVAYEGARKIKIQEMLASIKRRFGGSRIREIETRVLAAIEDESTADAVKHIFNDFR